MSPLIGIPFMSVTAAGPCGAGAAKVVAVEPSLGNIAAMKRTFAKEIA